MNTLHTSSIKPTASLSWLNTFIRKQLFKRLKKIHTGQILIKEPGAIYSFGECDKDARIKAQIVIEDLDAYCDIALRGSIGAAEAYVLGKWRSPNLVELVRIMSANIDILNMIDNNLPLWQNLSNKIFHRFNRNTEKQARDNIGQHYDLSNEFFALFLDSEMMYSSAIFPHSQASLEEAAVHKLELVCRKLDLQPHDHLLEIGSGWGGLACYAAKNYGCRVTTTTISTAQFEFTQSRIAERGLQDKVTLLKDDYRDLRGQFSKIVSIEMIEAVGHNFMPGYFRLLDGLLAPEGRLLLQAISIEDQRYESYRKQVDFIQRYILPGGHLISVSEIWRHVKEQTSMRINQFSDYGQHYAETIKIWNQRFLSQREKVLQLGFSEDFIRLWQYYFGYCEGAFRENVIGLGHIVMVKPRNS